MSPAPLALGAAEFSLLEAWVAENPGSRLFLRLARAYAQAGQPEDAARILERGLMLHPAEVEGRELLAQVLEERGDRDGALMQLKAAAAELGRHAGVYERLAGLLAARGLADEAAKAAGLGRDLAFPFAAGPGQSGAVGGAGPSPDTPTMAEIYAAQGMIEQAAAIYRRLLEQDPGNELYARRLAELAPSGSLLDGEAELLARLESLRRAALARAAGA